MRAYSQLRAFAIALCVMLYCAAPARAAKTGIPPPKPCAVLTANLSTNVAKSLTRAPDTTRIQSALNLCSPGKSVVLRSAGRHDAFLSAPLRLPRGVVLFVDAGTILYASRNARDYDLGAGKCGAEIADPRVPQCKPFIFSYQAVYSGVMGDGAIDGQGGAERVAKNGAWWDAERASQRAGRAIDVPDLISVYESQGFKLTGIALRNAAGSPASIYKTIAFDASSLKIDSISPATDKPALLLSNAQTATLRDIWIRTGADALALRASILGPTSDVKATGLHTFGGRGIAVGDATYGNVKSIEIEKATIQDAQAGLTFDLTGDRGGTAHNISYSNICLRDVAKPLLVERASGAPPATSLPPLAAIEFVDVLVANKGTLEVDGLRAGKAACQAVEPFSAAPQAIFADSRDDSATISQARDRRSLIVAADGSGDFATVQQAVDALPATGGEITVKPGTYREIVTIRKPHVRLRGSMANSRAVTIVYNGGPRSGGTFNSATVFVEADDVSLDHLTISNDLGFGKGQGVALHVVGDRDSFRNVRILGSQDTLFAAAKYCYGDYGPCVPARQYFRDCYVAGNVDFIFGDAIAWFERCELHGLPKGNVMFTAQSKHTAAQASGYVFSHCKLTADARGDGPLGDRSAGTVSLGRPWRPYASVVYLNARIDADVIPSGWSEWPRFGVPSLPTAYYAEFHSTGPGASAATREPYSHQLTPAEAARFSVAKILSGSDGWSP